MDQWGSVPGDVNAQAIISDRRSEKKTLEIVRGVAFFFMIGSALAYGASESHGALAFLIMSAPFYAASLVMVEISKAYTIVQVAERRAQLIEQKLEALQTDLAMGALVVSSRPART